MNRKFAERLRAWGAKLSGYAIWLLMILLAVSVIRNIGKVNRVRTQIQAEKDKLAKMKADNAKLEEEIAKSQGPEFIEKEIRDKLGLVKEGETVVVLPDEETLRKLAPKVGSEEDILPDPNWKRWLKLFS